MSVKQGEFGTLAVQAESTLGGSGTGPIYEVPGKVDFRFEPQFLARTTRVNFHRQASKESVGGLLYRGDLELELNPGNSLRTMLRTMFENNSTVGTVYTFRPWKLADNSLPGMKLFAHYESGPYLQFNGAVLDRLRIQARARQLTRVSMEWLALSMDESESDPSLTITTEGRNIAHGEDVLVEIDAAPAAQVIEAGIEFRQNLMASGFRDDNQPTKWLRDLFDVSGALVEFFDDSVNVPSLVRSLTEAAIRVKTEGQSDADGYVDIEIPRVVFESGTPSPVMAADVAHTAAFRGLGNAELILSIP